MKFSQNPPHHVLSWKFITCVSLLYLNPVLSIQEDVLNIILTKKIHWNPKWNCFIATVIVNEKFLLVCSFFLTWLALIISFVPTKKEKRKKSANFSKTFTCRSLKLQLYLTFVMFLQTFTKRLLTEEKTCFTITHTPVAFHPSEVYKLLASFVQKILQTTLCGFAFSGDKTKCSKGFVL